MAEQRGGEKRPVKAGTTLYRNATVIATFTEQADVKDGAIYVDGNVIKWVVDCSDKVIIPGMVNTHHHMYQSLTRCIAQDSPLFNWLTSLYPAWATMTSNDVYISAKLSMAELLLSGCTCSSDHLYIYPNDVTLDDTIRAAREIGMRFHPTRGIMTLGKSKGGLPPDNVVEETDSALEDAKRLIEQYHDPEKYSMMRVGIAPCSPFSVTNDCMEGAAKLARQYQQVRLHTHLAENHQDITYSEKTYGCRPGRYLQQVGWDRSDCWFAHCVMLDEGERKQFAECGLGVAHCPSSNARLASGICPVRQLRDEGVNVGLGVDGCASNDSGNLLEQARWALLLQRGLLRDVKGMKVREALEIAIQGGAGNLGRDDIGRLAPGYAADFVGWKLTGNVALSGGLGDPVGALILCTPGPVDLSVINGEPIIQDGKLLTCDLEELIREHNTASARVCAAVGSPDL
ncbi:hypothetical protein CHLNCDRAFT_145361 [Chlorella variabilis]|uniref:Amidohydrolase-related domain-containing protein n=1 Tax=Chlorella variabilis TaxID=554065 RepID=E1ZE95_CHLVA|nr:hypothetical protein CHLNCDRAFT_145361 [Chlorella variabilis]EFN55990.1 hypothetical protein CHLNCDRAFT_145361 [Chlorella variabilis]|eukprot:XP_005848092.1 hypothetical protein CHLNCDRAFT_145361 [Chlorella variabilis]